MIFQLEIIATAGNAKTNKNDESEIPDLAMNDANATPAAIIKKKRWSQWHHKKAVLISLIMSNGVMAFDGVSVRDPQSI